MGGEYEEWPPHVPRPAASEPGCGAGAVGARAVGPGSSSSAAFQELARQEQLVGRRARRRRTREPRRRNFPDGQRRRGRRGDSGLGTATRPSDEGAPRALRPPTRHVASYSPTSPPRPTIDPMTPDREHGETRLAKGRTAPSTSATPSTRSRSAGASGSRERWPVAGAGRTAMANNFAGYMADNANFSGATTASPGSTEARGDLCASPSCAREFRSRSPMRRRGSSSPGSSAIGPGTSRLG